MIKNNNYIKDISFKYDLRSIEALTLVGIYYEDIIFTLTAYFLMTIIISIKILMAKEWIIWQ